MARNIDSLSLTGVQELDARILLDFDIDSLEKYAVPILIFEIYVTINIFGVKNLITIIY